MKNNSISDLYFEKSELSLRIDPILEFIRNNTEFSPEKCIQQSRWWNSKHVGAMHYIGTYQGHSALLKIQGGKPQTSEVLMIHAFTQQNNSAKIRAPRIFLSLPWNEELQFEAFVMEDVGHEKIIHVPTTQAEITEFFDLYEEYTTNCVTAPWLEKPEKTLSEKIQENFAGWLKISEELHPNHPLRKPGDTELREKGLEVLTQKLTGVDWQFQHGHFSARDLHRVENDIVILSNLYWSWRMPYYDTIFAFHWYQYDLANSQDVSLETLLKQRNWWKQAITSRYAKTLEQKIDLTLAFLERNLASLTLDGLLPINKKTEALMEITREEIKTEVY